MKSASRMLLVVLALSSLPAFAVKFMEPGERRLLDGELYECKGAGGTTVVPTSPRKERFRVRPNYSCLERDILNVGQNDAGSIASKAESCDSASNNPSFPLGVKNCERIQRLETDVRLLENIKKKRTSEFRSYQLEAITEAASSKMYMCDVE